MTSKRVVLLKKIIDNYDGFLIGTYIAGVVLSSLAQWVAIKHNDKYSKQEKKFLTKQEWSDAGINCGLYALVTLPVRNLACKLIESGKYITSDCKEAINKYAPHKLADLGKFDTNIINIFTDLRNKNNTKDFEYVLKKCTALRNAAATCAVVGGGLIASCILAPIARNIIASYRHENTTTTKPQVNSTPVTKPNPQTKPNPEVKPRVETKPSAFDDFRTRVTGMKI